MTMSDGEIKVYEDSLESLYKQINILNAKVYFLERELNKYKRLVESKNRQKVISND